MNLQSDRLFARRVVITIMIASAFILLFYTARLLLLGFAGVLGGVILDTAASWLSAHSSLRRKWAYLVVLAGIISIAGVIAWLLAPRVVIQLSQLTSALPRAIDNARAWLNQFDWGRVLTSHMDTPSFGSLMSHVTQIGTVLVDVAIAITVMIVLTAYLGEDPRLYRAGLLALLPLSWRRTADDLLTTVAHTLRWWLIGQSVPMAVLGVVSLVGLLLLHIPLAFTLSLITGLMIFVPFAGSVAAYVITALVTLSYNPSDLLIVTILFLGIHILEGYVLTPLVQRRAVYLPPALTISAQVLMSILFGVLGLVLATPLAAAVLAVVRKFYVPQVANGGGES
ncbi:MAG TPA: AI-2E family transporter [Bryobacteraceae bacterium]|nr:AI-2E family transporter [Bryobacteraceae bacterium]